MNEIIEALDNDVLLLARELRDKNAENAKLRAALEEIVAAFQSPSGSYLAAYEAAREALE